MRPTVLPAQIERLLSLVSPRTGVVRNLVRIPRGVDEPVPPILYQATLSNFDFKKGQSSERSAAGKGLSEAEAIGGAIGEAVERYCASHIDLTRQRHARLDDLTGPQIAPAECVLYSARQYETQGFPYPRATPDVDVGWVPGRELPIAHEVSIPAAPVYLYGSDAGGPDFSCPPTSSGLAAGSLDHSAFFTPLERLTELDFLLRSVGSPAKAAPPDLDRGSPHANLETTVQVLTRAGCRVAYVDLTTADVAPFGIRVVRTIATGLQPIHFGHGEERLGGRRLFDVPRVLGHAAATRTEADLNPCPHPAVA